MQRSSGEKVVITVFTAIFCAINLPFAQGRIFPGILLNSQLAKSIFDGSYYLCMPGVVVAIAIWGYNSGRTILSDFVIVAVNTALYSILIILVLASARHATRFIADPELAEADDLDTLQRASKFGIINEPCGAESLCRFRSSLQFSDRSRFED
jgi:hypothetical protein